jgi:transposase
MTKVRTSPDSRRAAKRVSSSRPRRRSGNEGIAIDAISRARLTRLAGSATAPHRLVIRSRIVLLLEHNPSDRGVARHLGLTPRTVRRWRERFVAGGIGALLHDAPGRGRPAAVRPDVERSVGEYIERMQRGDEVPTLRALGRALGIGPTSVHRLLARAGLRRKSRRT